MTVQTTTSVSGPYNGTGVQVAFTFAFKIFAEGDLEVIETSAAGVETVKSLTTHYTVNAGPWPTGGTITMLLAPAAGTTLTIRRNLQDTQPTDYITGGKFPAEAHEDALDRRTMISQQKQADLNRAMLVPKSEIGTDMTLPPKATRASKFGAYDADGKPIAAAGTSANLTPVSVFMDTLLDDADAKTARQTLLLDKHGADIASAGTIDLDAATGDLIDITGSVTITAITLAEGVEKTTRTTGAPLFTHGASLVLPGAVNIQAAAGDFQVWRGYAGGVVRCVVYMPASAFKLNTVRCLVYRSSVQSIPNNAFTAIGFNLEAFDESSIHDNVTNNSRLTIPAGYTRAMLFAQIGFAANATGRRTAQFFKNGVSTVTVPMSASVAVNSATELTTFQIISMPLNVVAGDYLELAVYQNSGGNLDFSGGNEFSSHFGCWLFK